MSEARFQKWVIEWTYKIYGHIDVKRGTGLFKINKMAMAAGRGEAGWPDLAFFLRGGRVFFMELKNPDDPAPVTEIQKRRHEELQALGYRVYIVSHKNQVMEIIHREVNGAAWSTSRKSG